MSKVTLFGSPIRDEEAVSDIPQIEDKKRVDSIEYNAKFKRWKEFVPGEPDISLFTKKAPIYGGLLDIAGVLKNEGHDVVYLPLNLLYADGEYEKAHRLLKEHVKDSIVVGTTTYTGNAMAASKLLKVAKDENPDIISIIGGPHATIMDEESIVDPFVDIVVRGEGEITIKELMETIDKQKNDFKRIEGITYKNKDIILRNPGRREYVNLNKVPLPYYSSIPEEYREDLLGYITRSRGCLYNCTFCSETRFWGSESKKIRTKDAERTATELEMIRDYFNQRFVHIADSVFTNHNDNIDDVAEAMKNIRDMKFSINMRANYAPREKIEKLNEAGVIEYMFGIESASDRVLKVMRKGYRFKDAVKTLNEIKDMDIPFIGSYWIVGHPGETHGTAIESLDGLRYLYDNDLLFNSHASVFVPLPGTQPYENPEKYDMKNFSKNWKKYGRFSFPVYDLPGISRESIFQYYINMDNIKADNLSLYLGDSKINMNGNIKSVTY